MRHRSGSGLRACCALVLFFAVATGAAPATHGLEIVGQYIGGPGPAAEFRHGDGSVEAIFEAAASLWEEAILDDFTLPVQFGWSQLPGGSIGTAFALRGPNLRPASGVIFIDDTSHWFFDPTPADASEWSVLETPSFDLGAGEMVIGRDYTGATGDASLGWDLLTVFAHEIGHTLGLGIELLGFTIETDPDGDIDIAAPLPFAGTELLVTQNGGAHLLLTTALMFPSQDFATRSLPSDADILAVAQVSSFETVALPVPEPRLVTLLTLLFITALLASAQP